MARALQTTIGDRKLKAMAVMHANSGPLRLQDVARLAGCTRQDRGECWRPALAALVVEGKLRVSGSNVKLYALAEPQELPVNETENRTARVLEILYAADEPLTVKQLTERMGEDRWQDEERQRRVLNPLVASGQVEHDYGRLAKFWLADVANVMLAQKSDPRVAPDGSESLDAAQETFAFAPFRFSEDAKGAVFETGLRGPGNPCDETYVTRTPDTIDRLLEFVRCSPVPVSVAHLSALLGGVIAPTVGVLCNVLTEDGYLRRIAGVKSAYVPGDRVRVTSSAYAEGGTQVERYAVDVPAHGTAGVTDPDALDEIEAEKTWEVAAHLQAAFVANCGRVRPVGFVMEHARELMAEARRVVKQEGSAR